MAPMASTGPQACTASEKSGHLRLDRASFECPIRAVQSQRATVCSPISGHPSRSLTDQSFFAFYQSLHVSESYKKSYPLANTSVNQVATIFFAHPNFRAFTRAVSLKPSDSSRESDGHHVPQTCGKSLSCGTPHRFEKLLVAEAYGWIAVHFLGASFCFRQAVIFIDKDSRQRVEQAGRELGAICFGKLLSHFFNFSKRYHMSNVRHFCLESSHHLGCALFMGAAHGKWRTAKYANGCDSIRKAERAEQITLSAF